MNNHSTNVSYIICSICFGLYITAALCCIVIRLDSKIVSDCIDIYSTVIRLFMLIVLLICISLQLYVVFLIWISKLINEL